jgi:hypothetical protein
MPYNLPDVLSCLASNNAWRRQAAYLREHATLRRLTNQQRDVLLREAAAAERQADMWLEGAITANPIGSAGTVRNGPRCAGGTDSKGREAER